MSLSALVEYLQDNPGVDAHDLAYTLRCRRSLLQQRISFHAGSVDDLKLQIADLLRDASSPLGIRALPASSPVRGAAPKIIGVFSGQGAQYARMGAELLETVPAARRVIRELESNLASLPDGPAWSLQAELEADIGTSRVGEAAISQPLCTTVQILVLVLLRAARVRLGAVVGHSSGEIAAAYAAGFLTARNAMTVAYYRGVHAKLAVGLSGCRGAMMAVEDIHGRCPAPL